jgi:hypothetical protein
LIAGTARKVSDPKNISKAEFTTVLPKAHFLAASPPFATRPERLGKGGNAAKKCGLGKPVVFFGAEVFRAVPAIKLGA